MIEPLSVRARFERFPATIKGAFILRGEDADPHQVVLLRATLAGIGLDAAHEMPMASVTLDVAPHRDVFVPFEMSVAELEPGWYTMRCDLEVDGTTKTYDGGRRFSVAWPRASLRRGQVRVNRAAAVGDVKVLVETLECGGDSTKLHLRIDPPGSLTVKLSADGRPVEVLDSETDAAGRCKVTAYPMLRTYGTLRIELRGKGRGAEAALEVALPG